MNPYIKSAIKFPIILGAAVVVFLSYMELQSDYRKQCFLKGHEIGRTLGYTGEVALDHTDRWEQLRGCNTLTGSDALFNLYKRGTLRYNQ